MGYLPNWFQLGLSALFAFMMSLVMTPVIKKIALRADVIDNPDGDNNKPEVRRRIHLKPTPKLGGLAIAAGFFSAILLNLILDTFNLVRIMPPGNQLTGFMTGLAIIIIMGSLDDLYNLKPYIKFIFQFLAAGIVVFSGTDIITFTNPFVESGFSRLPSLVSIIFSLFWIVGLTNAINFIDGLDGLASGITSISLVSLLAVSLFTGPIETASVLFNVVLIGATLGFIPYNRNPAKIFMSDVGSNFLGFALAVITIQGATKSYAAIALAVPITVLALPLFDVIFAIFRRLAKKKKITEADRGHIHHRLLDIGFSQKQTVFVLYMASIALGVVAVVLAVISNNNQLGKVSALFALIFILALIVAFSIAVFLLKLVNRNKEGGG